MAITQEEINLLQTNPDLISSFKIKYPNENLEQYIGNKSDTLRATESETVDNNTENQENEDGRGLIADIGLQTLGGLADAGKNTLNLIENLGDTLGEKTGIGGFAFGDEAQDGFVDYLSFEELKERQEKGEASDFFFGNIGERDNLGQDIPNVPEADTMVGAFIRPTAQFLGSYFTGGKALKFIKPTTTAGKVGKGFIQGGIADFTAFDEHEARLSDLVQNTALENPVTEYLASDVTDSYAEGRFKNFIEGMFLGGVTESVFVGFRRYKRLKKAKEENNKAEFDKANKEETTKLNKTVNQTINDAQTKKQTTKLNKNKKKKKKQSDKALDELNNGKFDEDLDRFDNSIQAWRNQEINPRTNKPYKLGEILDETFASGQFAKLTSDSAIVLLNKIYTTLRQNKVGNNKQITNEEILRLADKMGEDPIKVSFDMLRMADEFKNAPIKVVAGEVVQMGFLENMGGVARAVKEGRATEEDFDIAYNLVMELSQAIDDVVSGSSRVLNARKIAVTEGADTMSGDAILNFTKLKKAGEEYKWRPTKEQKKKLIDKVAQINDPAKQSAFLKTIRKVIGKNGVWDRLNEFWINAILSSPKTHLINMTSNAIQSFITPLEMGIGGLLRRDSVAIREAVDTYFGLVKYWGDAFQMAKESLATNKNILDESTKIDLENKNAIQFGGNVVRLPSRFLGAEDEFFKQINYRAKLYAYAVQQTRLKNQGKKLTADEFSEQVEQIFKDGFDENGRGINSYALEYAQENTFTRSLNEQIDNYSKGTKIKRSAIGGNIQKLTNDFPPLKQIIPFIRTPVNIARNVWQRTPLLNLLQREYRNQLRSANPSVRANAYGKMALGSAIYVSAGILAGAGKITGGGSRDPQIRKQQLATGWKPYSFKVGDNYYSFERLDPWGMFFGLVADYNEIAKEVDDQTRDNLAMMNMMATIMTMDGEEVAFQGDIEDDYNPLSMKMARGITAVASNLSSKTYLKGVSDLISLVQSGDENKVDRILKSKVGSFVPNIIKKLSGDPYYREVRTYTDSIMAGLPYFNEKLEPKYDYKGEKVERVGSYLDNLISPISIGKDKNDFVADKIAELNHRFTPPDERVGVNGNINLTQFKNAEGKTAYLVLNEKIGTIKLGNPEKTLRERLTDLFNSDDYKNMSDPVKGFDMNMQGGKVVEIQKILLQYRQNAIKEIKRSKAFKNEEGIDLHKMLNLNKQTNTVIKSNRAEDYLNIK